MNRTSVTGRVGKHAELRQSTQSGSIAISFSVATSKKWTDKAGNAQESTTWYNCTKWVNPGGSTKVHEFLVPGQQVLLEGEVSARGWLDKEGKPQASLELNVFALELLGSAKDHQAAAPAAAAPLNQVPPDTSDDLPF